MRDRPSAPADPAGLGLGEPGLGREPWPGTAEEARALQALLTHRVIERDELGPVRRIAGIDVHYAPARELAWAAVAVLDAGSLDLVESTLACQAVSFPYVPGLLSFREVPAALAALALLKEPPDLLMVDGQGRAHPRGLGIASHLGILTGLPTIGVAKSRLVGTYAEPERERGARSELRFRKRVVGAVLRTRPTTRPLFVSIGHRVSLERAVELTLACATRWRLPEPTRLADLLSRCHPS